MVLKSVKKTTEQFINEAREVHGDKYDYSKVKYDGANTKVCIICHKTDKFGYEHGEFWQTPHNHLSNKTKCPKCCGNHNSYTKEEFIEISNKIHNNKYNYEKIKYINLNKKVCIICPEHGEFWQTPNKHLLGQGCPKCGIDKRKEKNCLTTEEFIKRAREVHGDKYDYSKVNYINANTKVCIICPKHGEFWQNSHHHLNYHGCPFCNEYKMEKEIKKFLSENNINYEYQKRFSWLGKQSLDFYLPDYNVAIECQGIQHFECNEFFGGKEGFNKIKQRDLNKKEKCDENKIKIFYFSNLKIKFPYHVYTDKNKLLIKLNQNI